ncbi:MAG: hypothetical protein K2J10_04355 [Muribaculaceae bacterium]|nr:hypothetical protein [Muribaculaceae bacterium]
MKNNSYYKKMWVAFVNIIAEKGYKFDDFIDNEGRTDLPKSNGAVAYIVVQSENMRTAIEIVHKGLAEKHSYVYKFYRIDNLDSLIQNNAARKIDIKTARHLEKSEYVFEISGRVWPYMDFPDYLDSNLWIVRAKESNFEYLKNSKNKGNIEISEKMVYAIVKCDKIYDCPYWFTMGCKNDNLSIKIIDSIMNFNEYLVNHNAIDDVLWDAEYLRNSDKNFIYTSLSD